MIKLDWKIYSIAIGIALLAVSILFLEKLFFFFVIALATLLTALFLRFVQPAKYIGVELVTLSTILVGIIYGPVVGGVYAFVILLSHFMLGNYHIGVYLSWVIPEYVLLGVLSGIFGASMIGPLGVALIVGLNLLNLFLTFVGENDRVAKELPYVIGNTILNSVILLQFLSSIVSFID